MTLVWRLHSFLLGHYFPDVKQFTLAHKTNTFRQVDFNKIVASTFQNLNNSLIERIYQK